MPSDLLTPERYRSYLLVFARLHLDSRLRGKLDASDVVQSVLIRAHTHQEQFRGTTVPEFLAWLRAILAQELAETVRKYSRQRRDINLERSIHNAIDSSASCFDGWLAANDSTPVDKAMRREMLIILADTLGDLPADQREAIELHHFQNLSLVQTAESMGRSREAVAGLLYRGVRELRRRMTQAFSEA
jgi:RNA polymerase sigma-70 factor (ECF subfamily)